MLKGPLAWLGCDVECQCPPECGDSVEEALAEWDDQGIVVQCLGLAEEEEDSDEPVDVAAQHHVWDLSEPMKPTEREELELLLADMELELMPKRLREAQQYELSLATLEARMHPPTELGATYEIRKGSSQEGGAFFTDLATSDAKKVALWRTRGFQLIMEQSVAVFIMAGGEEILEYPLCTVDLGLPSGKPILQLLLERVRRLNHMVARQQAAIAGKAFKPAVELEVPVFVMCNEENHQALKKYLRDNNYFGLASGTVSCFCQQMTPLMDSKCRLLMRDRGDVWLKPGGSAALLQGMLADGLMSELKVRGVDYMYVCGADNPSVKVLDPAFLGFSSHHHSLVRDPTDCVCIKGLYIRAPPEPLAILGSTETKLKGQYISRGILVEANEAPADLSTRKSKNRIVFNVGSLNQYCITTDSCLPLLQTLTQWHLKRMSVPALHRRTGKFIEPKPHSEPNAVHLSRNLGDICQEAGRTLALVVGQEEDNFIAPHRRSLADAAVWMMAHHQEWIRAAGGTFSENTYCTGKANERCEVSPLVSYEGENLGGYVAEPLEMPVHVASSQERGGAHAGRTFLEDQDELDIVTTRTSARPTELFSFRCTETDFVTAVAGRNEDPEALRQDGFVGALNSRASRALADSVEIRVRELTIKFQELQITALRRTAWLGWFRLYRYKKNRRDAEQALLRAVQSQFADAELIERELAMAVECKARPKYIRKGQRRLEALARKKGRKK
mmetsp:Transcript_58424/g.156187  ORF Transcript_58424/g.156187 Transcript_58424/m.156187 type:complete len:731 (+) Transcript_58424:118-2310(+)